MRWTVPSLTSDPGATTGCRQRRVLVMPPNHERLMLRRPRGFYCRERLGRCRRRSEPIVVRLIAEENVERPPWSSGSGLCPPAWLFSKKRPLPIQSQHCPR